MPPTITRVDPSHVVTDPKRAALGWVAAGIIALVVAVAAGEVLQPPSTVDVTVVNESGEPVTVVVGDDDVGHLPVASLGVGEERPVREVLDQGDRWTVTHRFADDLVEQRTVTRSELAGRDFRLVVPAATGR